MLHLVQTRHGRHKLATDVRQLHSVLTAHEARGLTLIDPAPWLHDDAQKTPSDAHVGLLATQIGPPIGIWLGKIERTLVIPTSQLVPLSPWLSTHLSPILYPACVIDASPPTHNDVEPDSDASASSIIWLLNLGALVARWQAMFS